MHKFVVLLLFITVTASSLWAITGTAAERTARASVSPTYPVTPGDTYRVVYTISGKSFTVELTVDKNFLAQVPGFGEFQTEGLTYYELKAQVEKLVNDVFPGSVPVMTMINPGIFEVLLKGEVTVSTEVAAWSFERLSAIVDASKTPYTSFRDVEIISRDGTSRLVDIFMGRRTGEMKQDPYLKFGDTIILRPYERQIVLGGEVKRPGTYQLREGETLRDAIQVLGGGFTAVADREHVQISRILGSPQGKGSTFYKDLSNASTDLDLMNLDSVTVSSWTNYRPLVYLQGAIGTTTEGTSVSSKVAMNITEGEYLSSILRKSQDQFTKVSDLEHVSVIRFKTGESIEVNAQELLLTGNRENDLVLMDRDMIIIPFTQYYVYVSGSVSSPGKFPYIVNKSWEYYVGLAGGFNIDEHSGTKVKITDVYGEKHKQKERIIQPEDVIYAPRNNPIFWIGKYGSDIAILTTSVTSLVILLNYMGNVSSDSYHPIPTP